MIRFDWLRRLIGRASGPARPYSLRRRLLASLLGASALLWLVSLGIMVSIAWDETSEVFDDGLEDAAYLIRAAAAGLPQPTAPIADPVDRDRRHAGLYYQIVAKDRVLRRSGSAPEEPFVTGFDKRKGFRTVLIGVVPWRVFVLRSQDNRFEVQVGQPLEARTEILEELAENLTWPALGLLALLGAVIWLAVGRLIRPVEQTALAIVQKTPEDLTPVAVAEPPLELSPIIDSLNTVFARLDKALQSERRFTADAAHELRTPLAALRMKIQLLERQHPEHQSSLRMLRDDADRCTALAENLLALARLDADRPDLLAREPVALPALLEELRRSYAAQAEARQIDLVIDCRVASLYGNAELLRVALRNLLDNALRYCPSHSRVRIEAQSSAQGVRLAVRDDGPGVPEPLRGRLAERFFRVLGTDQTGSGLGLSIVERIAALHGAALRFEDGLDRRRLGVILDFPQI
ncbi:ATP-binding protein [Methylocaldum szegediense]|uniref:ATP-binding protein n=1 Tax=Methylocaldum szegediense TaxID=73780 RepID=UPI0004155220|nr:ATP-binding protein [Methylocaldum szegediense]